MELIIINENKLKISMTKEDMIIYGLDENEFHCSTSNTREILNRILKNCQRKTGFENLDIDERLLLQLYPDKSGGCELFVTKLPLDYGTESNKEKHLKKEKEPQSLLPGSSYNVNAIKKLALTYSFKTLDDLICACKSIAKQNIKIDSQLYFSNVGKYYLFLHYRLPENEKNSPSSYLSEYGELENSENSFLYMHEYGKCVCENGAIEILASF